MSSVVTLGSKNQAVIPKGARDDALHLEPGKRLLVQVEGDMIVMIPEPEDYLKALRGLHKEVWEGIDTDGYLRREKDAWNDD